MTTAGFNIKTTYFVRNNGLFFILRNNVFKREAVFVVACCGVFFDETCFFRRECNPARGTDFLDMEETQDRRNIGFIDICARIRK
jgi:hypothetical protein